MKSTGTQVEKQYKNPTFYDISAKVGFNWTPSLSVSTFLLLIGQRIEVPIIVYCSLVM